jgi:hypothetical protein
VLVICIGAFFASIARDVQAHEPQSKPAAFIYVCGMVVAIAGLVVTLVSIAEVTALCIHRILGYS